MATRESSSVAEESPASGFGLQASDRLELSIPGLWSLAAGSCHNRQMHADSGGPVDLEGALANIAAPVKLVFFTQTFGCETCLPARQVVDRVAAMSDQISVEEFNLVLDTDQVEAYGIQRVPALAVVGDADAGIRFYGVADGHELVSLVESILLVASGDAGLSDESQTLIAALEQPIDIQVFVTPT